MNVIFDGHLHVHYGQAYVYASHDETPDFEGAVRGQQNGICGAAEMGRLLLLTGLHTGHVGFRLEMHDSAPILDETCEEIVEASFQTPTIDRGEFALVDWERSVVCHIPLKPGTSYRVRYCARGMDRGKEVDTIVDEDPVDFYHLVFWPAPYRPDAVLKQTDQIAAYWHAHARSLL